MPAPEITFDLLDGPQAAAHAADVEALQAEVYSALPGGRADISAQVPGEFRVQARQPGFVLAGARSGGYLIGCAAGMPLRPSTSWWRHLTSVLPEDVTTEHAGRTFALVELSVRASWRRQGIGRYLHDLILNGRAEERATLVVAPAAAAAQTAFQEWGWHRIARTRGPDAGAPASDVLVLGLQLDWPRARQDLYLAGAILTSLAELLTDDPAPPWTIRVGTCFACDFPWSHLHLGDGRRDLLGEETGRRHLALFPAPAAKETHGVMVDRRFAATRALRPMGVSACQPGTLRAQGRLRC